MTETIELAMLWKVILALCTGIITVTGAGTAIYKIAHKAKEPEVKQNQRISELEKQVKEINERLERGDRHFDNDCQRMDALEKRMKETNQVIIESLQALTAHAIDNSKIDDLVRAEKSLNRYLCSNI